MKMKYPLSVAIGTLYCLTLAMPAFSQSTIAPGSVVIQESNDSNSDELATCVAALNEVQNEAGDFLLLQGRRRLGILIFNPSNAYKFRQPSNVSDDEMYRAGLRNRDDDEFWVGPMPEVEVREMHSTNYSNREIMEICLERLLPGQTQTVEPQPLPAETAELSRPIVATTPAPQVVIDPVTSLLTQWGWTRMDCTANAAQIVGLAEEMICVVPNTDLPTGQYVYDRVNNQLTPASSESITSRI